MTKPVAGPGPRSPQKPKGGGKKKGNLGGRAVTPASPSSTIKRIQAACFGGELGQEQMQDPIELTDENLKLANRLYRNDMPRDSYQCILEMVIKHKKPFVEIAEKTADNMSWASSLYLYDAIAAQPEKWPYIKEYIKEDADADTRWYLAQGILETDGDRLEAAKELLHEENAHSLLFIINHVCNSSAADLKMASSEMRGKSFSEKFDILKNL